MKEGATAEVALVAKNLVLQDLLVGLRSHRTCVEREDSTIIPHSTPHIDMTAKVTNLMRRCLLSSLHPHILPCVAQAESALIHIHPLGVVCVSVFFTHSARSRAVLSVSMCQICGLLRV